MNCLGQIIDVLGKLVVSHRICIRMFVDLNAEEVSRQVPPQGQTNRKRWAYLWGKQTEVSRWWTNRGVTRGSAVRLQARQESSKEDRLEEDSEVQRRG